MNILWINERNISRDCGGIESITLSLADIFKTKGIKSHLCYFKSVGIYDDSNIFSSKFQLSLKENIETKLYNIIRDNQITLVLIQQFPDIVPKIANIRNKLPNPLKIIYIQHDYLSVNLSKSVKNYIKFNLKIGSLKEKIKSSIKILFWKYYYRNSLSKVRSKFLPAFKGCDKIVVLSSRFIPNFVEIYGSGLESKLTAISNCLTLDYYFDIKELWKKKKQVLLVSRLVEDRKRISLVFKIWSGIMKQHKFNEWELIIVGDGPHRQIYENLCRKFNLENVSFKGKQKNVYPYYYNASVFIFTSDVEGWGLTLTEAQQMGVVPIAFDSYESIHDIITNQKDGILIQEGDINGYIDSLSDLMNDTNKRNKMAEAGILNSARFSPNLVAQKWYNLFNTI